jgi:hypothetical protein
MHDSGAGGERRKNCAPAGAVFTLITTMSAVAGSFDTGNGASQF